MTTEKAMLDADSPTIEESVAETKKETKEEFDLDGLMSQLKAVGVTNTEQLENKLNASREAGNLARMLGDVKKQNQELTELVSQLQSSGNKNMANESHDFDEPVSGAIDLKSEIRNAIREEKKQE